MARVKNPQRRPPPRIWYVHFYIDPSNLDDDGFCDREGEGFYTDDPALVERLFDENELVELSVDRDLLVSYGGGLVEVEVESVILVKEAP